MVRLAREDYGEMIRAGINCFRVDAEQAPMEAGPFFRETLPPLLDAHQALRRAAAFRRLSAEPDGCTCTE